MNNDAMRREFEDDLEKAHPLLSTAWDTDYNEYVYDEVNQMYFGYCVARNRRPVASVVPGMEEACKALDEALEILYQDCNKNEVACRKIYIAKATLLTAQAPVSGVMSYADFSRRMDDICNKIIDPLVGDVQEEYRALYDALTTAQGEVKHG